MESVHNCDGHVDRRHLRPVRRTTKAKMHDNEEVREVREEEISMEEKVAGMNS